MTILTGILTLILIFITILIIRTVKFSRKPLDDTSTETKIDGSPQAAEHLSEALQFKTVSHHDKSLTDWDAFKAFHAWLKRTYPHAHTQLEREIIHTYTLHYIWQGTNQELEPILLTAHQDVVPEGDLSGWEHPPFAGETADGYLWGRGSIDVKIQIIEIFEAIELLISKGFKPERTVHLCFGHDEELGGTDGAAKAAHYFEEQGLHFSMVLDEGGAVTENVLPGITQPIATIGIGEKGYMDLTISCSASGGHSSMPMPFTALSKVSQAINTLQSHPLPTRLTTAPAEMFRTLGPYMSLVNRIALANLWLFKPLFLAIMAKNAASNAMVRTTMAATMAHGSDAPNILPTEAYGLMNIRLLPGDSSDKVLAYAKHLIKDKDITIGTRRKVNPSAISPTNIHEFALLRQSVTHIFPDAIISPYLMAGGSDARKYEKTAENIYRFCPYQLDAAELGRMHGYNERISLVNIQKGVSFFLHLIQSFTLYQ